jgi:hypothetical protein
VKDGVLQFIGDRKGKLFKMLGRNLHVSLSEEHLIKICKDSLDGMLEKVDKCSVDDLAKVWIYQHGIVPRLSWLLFINDFNVSAVSELEVKVTRCLKKWLHLPSSASISLVYLSRKDKGLGVTSVMPFYRQMLACKAALLKPSNDAYVRTLYDYCLAVERNDEKRLCKPSMMVESAIGAVRSNELIKHSQSNRSGLGFGVRKTNLSSKKESRKEITSVIKNDENEKRKTHLMSLAVQGSVVAWDELSYMDISWNRIVYNLPPAQVKFLVKSTLDVLPTPANLRRWWNSSSNKCPLCNGYGSMKHILSFCKVGLNQGRLTWRHDSILRILMSALKSKAASSKKSTLPYHVRNRVGFVSASSGRVYVSQNKVRRNFFSDADDWNFVADLDNEDYMFPPHIAITRLRPDIVFYSESLKKVAIVELTVPAPENVKESHMYKVNKYKALVDDIKQYQVDCFCIEVSTLGYRSFSMEYFLSSMGISKHKLKNRISDTALKCSYYIYLSRNSVEWSSPQELNA